MSFYWPAEPDCESYLFIGWYWELVVQTTSTLRVIKMFIHISPTKAPGRLRIVCRSIHGTADAQHIYVRFIREPFGFGGLGPPGP